MSDRKTHWEQIYQKRLPVEVSWYQKEPGLSLQLIDSVHLPFDAPLIDVGGGASTLVDKLCDEGYRDISVLDISPRALGHAKTRLAGQAGMVEWVEADVTHFKPSRRYALWHDRAVFHFLTEKTDREKYISILKQALEPGGHLIMMAFAIGGPTKCSGLDIVQYDVNKLMKELGMGFQLVASGHKTHITPTGNRQKFAYFHLIFNTETE